MSSDLCFPTCADEDGEESVSPPPSSTKSKELIIVDDDDLRKKGYLDVVNGNKVHLLLFFLSRFKYV